MDDLIERLRVRAADPKRRTDAPQSVSIRGAGGTMTTQFGSLGSILGGGVASGRGGTGAAPAGGFSLSSLIGDLRGVVAANQAGRPIDPDVAARADAMAATFTTENATALPARATAATLDEAERALGFALPPELRRLYLEVADGGFGPGGGLLPIESAVRAYQDLTGEPPGPKGQRWPAALVPLVDRDGGYDALDVETGKVIAWDPEELTERSGDKAWHRSFSELASSLEAWLSAWVDARPAHEVMQERLNNTMVEEARKARAAIGAKTPEERRAMGLPEVGWEKVVWGGLGLDDDEAQSRP